MRSNNPIFSRSEEFNRPAYGAGGYSAATMNDPSTWSTGGGADTASDLGYAPQVEQPMTIDSVVQKSAMTIGLVIVTAAITWMVTPEVTEADAGTLYLALMIGSFGAFGLSLVNSFKRVVSPALVLAFAALEGVALGAFSKFIDGYVVADSLGSSVVVQAVMGTFAAFAGTLAAYKFFNIQVGAKFRTFVIAAMFGMVGLGLLEMVLRIFNADVGLFGFGTLGLLFAVAGLVLGVFMLILDFDFVEQGIANGIPERESWRAAFALTVSLVWIYTNLLRILAILQSD